jgi:predicted DNA-binding ribbon-helix-helix protein
MNIGVLRMSDEDNQRRGIQVSTRLEPELVRAVEERARAERRTTSNLIAKLVADGIGAPEQAA